MLTENSTTSRDADSFRRLEDVPCVKGAVSLALALRRDHERLDALFEELANVIVGDDCAAIHDRFSSFELALRAHLAFEEVEILPRLPASQGEVVARARREHATVRCALEDLGMAIELHTLRADRMNAFLEMLRAHARWEDECFYPLIDGASASPRERRSNDHPRIAHGPRGELAGWLPFSGP